ncbi:MAG: hypothetical protein LBC81_00965 [Tannerellaceae bacterium]|nr:hypothetical protein [Tannerellaceae bacterium]
MDNIPTIGSYFNNKNDVKIKNTFLEIQPADLGCPEINWFYCNNEKYDSILINEARNPEKLNLDKWNIIDLLKYVVDNGKIKNVDDWVKNAQPKIYYACLKEIENIVQRRRYRLLCR